MIAIALAAVVVQTPPAAKTDCKSGQPIAAAYDQSIKPHRLGDMPPGMLVRAVMITVGGCAVAEERDISTIPTANWQWVTLGAGGRANLTPLDGGR
jgi:hypothetical protein